MKRTLSLIVATALALVSTELQAVGLAEMQVLSRLDEPLRARIPLVDSQGVNLGRLHAYLADEADFEGIELPRAAIIDDLQLTVNHEGGNPVLLLRTEQAVNEPYLELLLMLEWPEGKQQHQVTILLDPPGYANSSAFLDDSPLQTISTLTAASISKLPDSSGRSNSGDPVTASEEHPRQLQARAGDALSSLAERARRGKNATLEQAMLALLTSNPDAFSRNNINALRAGSVLDVPSREEMSAFDAGQARRRVREQNDAWQSRHETRSAVDNQDATPLEQVATQAEAVGDTAQESLEMPAPEENGTLAASDDEASRGDARALAMAVQQQESRLGELEIDRETIHEALAAMRQERERLAGDVASLREELAGLHDEVAEALQVLSPPTAQTSSAGNVAIAADEVRGVAGESEAPSGWQRVMGYLPTVGGMTAVVLLAFLLRQRRQRHTLGRWNRADPSPRKGDGNESEPMPSAPTSWPASATSSALPLVSDGFNESKSAPEAEDKRQLEGNGNGQDDVERIMDYEPSNIESVSYQRAQECSPEDSDAASTAQGLAVGKDNTSFDQKPNTGEEWEVEEVTFEALQLSDKPSDPETFKR
nr:FimV/HubP family polar landmark protein [uncultured Halomonas sp.]